MIQYKIFGVAKTIPEWVEEFPFLWGKDLLEYGFKEVVIEAPEIKFEWSDKLVADCYEFIREDSAGVLTRVGVERNVNLFKQSKSETLPEPGTKKYPAGTIIEDVRTGNVMAKCPRSSFIKDEFNQWKPYNFVQKNFSPDTESFEKFIGTYFEVVSLPEVVDGKENDTPYWRVGERVEIDIEVDGKIVPWTATIQQCIYFDKKATVHYWHPRLNQPVYKSFLFSELRPVPSTLPKEEKKPLFKTEDGVEIEQGYRGDLWRVFIVNHSYEMWKPYNLGLPQFINSKEEKYFSTELAAQQYVLDNRPMFSLREILNVKNEIRNEAKGYDTRLFLNNAFVSLAKQKTNQ